MKAMKGGTDWWNRRFRQTADVPIYLFAVVPADHPDLKVIDKAYREEQGLGIGTDTALKYDGPREDFFVPYAIDSSSTVHIGWGPNNDFGHLGVTAWSSYDGHEAEQYLRDEIANMLNDRYDKDEEFRRKVGDLPKRA